MAEDDSIIPPAGNSDKQPSLFGNFDQFPELHSPDQAAQPGFIRAYQYDDPRQDKVSAIDVVMWAKGVDYPTAQGLLDHYKREKPTSARLAAVEKLKALAPDNKMRKTDFLTLEQAYDFVLDIPGKQSDALRKYLISLGVERYEESRVPGLASQNARKRDLALLQSMGYGNTDAAQYLEDRIKGIDGFKLLMETIQRVCEQPQYGAIINTEYLLLFGEAADGLREILNTKSIRDKLPQLQYQYLRTAEVSLREIIKRQDQLSMDQVLSIIERVVKPLGELLKEICATLGIHHITGQPLVSASAIAIQKAKQQRLIKGSN